GLGDLRDRCRWVVLERHPCLLGDLLDRLSDHWLQADPDRELPARPLEPTEGVLRPESRVGAQQLRPARARAFNTGDQLVKETFHPAGSVRRSGPQTDVNDLASIRPHGEDRVIAPHPGVAEAGTLLAGAVGLTD